MHEQLSGWKDTIVALATPQGIGAIGIIRLSGADAISIANKIFRGKDLHLQESHTAHFGHVFFNNEMIDEVVVTLFKNPRSYTGEDTVEFSGHGSGYVLKKIIEAAVAAGARPAKPGEFTQRAFLNGKLDLAQAEAVADLIAANTKAAQQTALAQLRGGFSNELNDLREQLINFTALIELELDFSQEDVTFADRQQFRYLISNIKTKILGLIQSFQLGNAIKNGISIAIIGKPNSGKSTLLNALLNEERAIVSDIAGTTRDTIEETLNINEILFRLIDTAGIREHAKDAIENIGMERSRLNAEKANLILHLIDVTNNEAHEIDWLNNFKEKTITVYNKSDLLPPSANDADAIIISAKEKRGIDELKQCMYEKALGGIVQTESTIVTNIRHQTALIKVAESLEEIQAGIENNISTDLLASDIRRALHYLGEITGQVEIDRDI
ncbi:MAG: tRNA uridine-5-carboxymethylaminomethyl(34) synthesis GTPase MnmE, partial [Chitinophagaceae bacterium]|nr:tRNA uridine-5-carboxymethylaminomethyl(34) synthesis GTPase MnmE [Chitinophagaceae bacterium]